MSGSKVFVIGIAGLLTFVFATGFSASVYAQTVDESEDPVPISEEETDDGGSESLEEDGSALIDIESSVGTQSVVSNKVPLYVVVTPSIDSSKAQITWDVPRGLETDSAVDEWFEMNADVAQTFRIDVEPIQSGRYEIVVDVTAWRYDTNYVTSTVLEFEIDDELHITPQTQEYKQNRMMYTVLIFIVIALLIVGVGVGLILGYKWFKKWMSED